MIDTFLKEDLVVCLVAFSQTLQHYTAVSKKIGRNIASAKVKDNFHFINQLTTPPSMDAWNTTALQSIYNQFCDVIEKAGDKSVCFLVDDLTVMSDCTDKPQDMLTFIKYCRSLISDKHTFMCLSQTTEPDAEEMESKLMTEIMHQADLLLVIRPLSTGYSKDIHGRISIFPFSKITTSTSTRPLPELLHFVVQETGVKVFVPGAH